MKAARTAHLIRRLERTAQDKPARFRALAALVGNLVPLLLASGLSLLVVVAASIAYLLTGPLDLWRVSGLVLLAPVGAGLVYLLIGAALLRTPPPAGHELRRAQAAPLFEVIDHVRHTLGGPPLQRVSVDGGFGLRIVQLPRFGLFGGHRNHLVMGLPYLFALSSREFAAALAHELSHLAGPGSTASARLRRQYVGFELLATLLRQPGDTPLRRLPRALLERIAPVFTACNFVQARQDEYRADTVAARITGSAANANHLIRSALLAHWLDEEFWPQLLAQADDHLKPQYLPNASLRTLFAATYLEWSTPERLRAALQRHSATDDTHPCLRERLHAIGHDPQLPPPVDRHVADKLLGPLAGTLAKELDIAWWQTVRAGWLARYRERRAQLQRITELAGRPLDRLSAAELEAFALALAACGRAAEARPALERLLNVNGDGQFARARLLYGTLLLDSGDAQGMRELARAATEDSQLLPQAAEHGRHYLRRTEGDAAADNWAHALSARTA